MSYAKIFPRLMLSLSITRKGHFSQLRCGRRLAGLLSHPCCSLHRGIRVVEVVIGRYEKGVSFLVGIRRPRILHLYNACTFSLNSLENFNAVTMFMLIMVHCRGFASPWWNDECREAAHNLRSAETADDRKHWGKKLKQVTRYAKRDWANKFINESNIWEVAAWRHGRRSSHIPALIDQQGTLTYDHQGMSDILSERFFTKAREDIPTSFTDDPPAAVTRDFPPFNVEEIFDLLKQTANKSAPGSSGIGWELLKRGWPHMDRLLTRIFTACISLHYHPTRWKEAVVLVIPKPGKKDYSQAKAHRPISLLVMGKFGSELWSEPELN
jgi:hypothetical protein